MSLLIRVQTLVTHLFQALTRGESTLSGLLLVGCSEPGASRRRGRNGGGGDGSARPQHVMDTGVSTRRSPTRYNAVITRIRMCVTCSGRERLDFGFISQTKSRVLLTARPGCSVGRVAGADDGPGGGHGLPSHGPAPAAHHAVPHVLRVDAYLQGTHAGQQTVPSVV